MRGIPLPAVKRLHTGHEDRICFELPEYSRAAVWSLLRKAHKKHRGMVQLIIDVPMRKRSTGKNSQNAHINGHCQQLAMETGNSFRAVKERMKELAVNRGYPFETLPDGSTRPKSEAEITVDEAKHLIDAIHQFADEWFFVLIEVNNDED